LCQGVANVSVILQKADTTEVVAEARTDYGGEFEFLDASPGTYDVVMSLKGGRREVVKRLSLQKGFDVEIATGWGTAD
jgi:hypothetical protein